MAEGLKHTGVISESELAAGPGIPSEARRQKGAVAVIECIEPIPCNPCEASCKAGAILVGEDITGLPRLDGDTCIGCLSCIPICPGQAIFAVDESLPEGKASVSMPYEFLPLPGKGETVIALDRAGKALGECRVTGVRKTDKMDKTAVVTLEVPREWSMKARAFRRRDA